MIARKLSKPFVLIPLLGLVVALGVDLSARVRPSGIAAIACVPQLLASRPDAVDIVTRYLETIVDQAGIHDLPPELLAAVIINHQAYISPFRRFTDCFGSAFGANLSLGLAQLRLSTAAQLDGSSLADLTARQYRRLRSDLLEPETNIAYEARELRALLEREHRYPGMKADELIHDPFAMALTITEYRIGRRASAREDSRMSANAFNGLQILRDDALGLFGREQADAQAISAEIGAYLDGIYCDSGIFNAATCADWRRAEKVTPQVPQSEQIP